jgi:acyl carrier protein
MAGSTGRSEGHMDTEQRLLAILKEWTKDKVEIGADTKLSELSLDSLDLAEIVFEIEDKFQIEMDKNDMEIAGVDFRGLCQLVDKYRGSQKKTSDTVPA